MSMPAPFETPVQMPKSHVRMLHALRREVRERAELPALKSEVKDEGVCRVGVVLDVLYGPRAKKQLGSGTCANKWLPFLS